MRKIVPSYQSGWILIGNWWYNTKTGKVLAPISGGGTNAYYQQAYRFVADDGAANAGTLQGSGNNDPISQGTGTENRNRVRIVVEETTGNKTETQYWELWASYDGGAYFHVTTSSSYIRSVGSLNDGWTCTDEDATTARLGYSGSFSTGRWDDDGSVETGVSHNGSYTEVEYCYYLVDADVSNGIKIYLQLRKSGGGGLNGYNQTAEITVVKEELTQVYDDIEFVWDMRELVNDDLVLQWDLLNLVYDDIEFVWDIFDTTQVYDDIEFLWDIRELIQDDLELVWDILESYTWPHSDDFEGYTASQNLGGQGGWVAVLNNLWVVDNSGDNIVRPNSSGNEACVRYDAAPASADYWAEVTLDAVASGVFIGPSVRCQSGASTYYVLYADDSDIYLGRVVGGSWTTLDSVTGGSFSQSDKLRLGVSGTGATVTLTCLVNGSPYTNLGDANGEYDDTDANRITATGYAGVAGYNTGNTYADDFLTGNLEETTPVNDDLVLQWDILDLVYDDLELVWDLNNTINDDLVLQWDLLNLVNDDTELIWDIHNLATDDLELVWDMQELATDDIEFVWDMAGVVNDDLVLVWDILQSSYPVNDDLVLQWDIHELVTDDLALPYDIFNLVSDDLALPYDIFNIANDDLVLVWDLLNLVNDDLVLQWDILDLVYDDLELVWDIYILANDTVQFLYDIRQLAYDQIRFVWDLGDVEARPWSHRRHGPHQHPYRTIRRVGN